MEFEISCEAHRIVYSFMLMTSERECDNIATLLLKIREDCTVHGDSGARELKGSLSESLDTECR